MMHLLPEANKSPFLHLSKSSIQPNLSVKASCCSGPTGGMNSPLKLGPLCIYSFVSAGVRATLACMLHLCRLLTCLRFLIAVGRPTKSGAPGPSAPQEIQYKPQWLACNSLPRLCLRPLFWFGLAFGFGFTLKNTHRYIIHTHIHI